MSCQTNKKPGMRKHITLVTIIALISNLLFAQKNDDKPMEIVAPGSFAKAKILPNVPKLAIGQLTVTYKLASTAKVVSREKFTGNTAGARITAYLETTDGDLTQDEFQGLTDYFYSYLQKKMKENGIDTVAWSTIAGTDFYASGSEKMDLDPSDGYTITAHKGNILYAGTTGFAFGKIKKASKFCEDIDAPVGFFHVTLDFADVMIGLDIHTEHHENMFYSVTTEHKQYKWAVKPEMQVTPTTPNTNTMFWNEKSQSENLLVRRPIAVDANYATNVTDDPSRLRSGFAKMWAFRKEVSPIVIETTRAQYLAAAKKALENYADQFIALTRN